MGSKRRLATALLLAIVLGRPAQAGDSSPAPTPTPAPSPKASPRPRRAPIILSVDRAVDEVLKEHEQPCARAERDGVPCFPVTVETQGPRFSVAEALRRYQAIGGRPAPGGPPTTAEIQQHLSGAQRSASGGYSFDPGCGMKSLVRMIGGGGNTFYLYRIQDRLGTQPLLTDRKLSREALAARPEVRELLGEFFGECAAVAAWRKALREQLASERADDPRPGTQVPKEAPQKETSPDASDP